MGSEPSSRTGRRFPLLAALIATMACSVSLPLTAAMPGVSVLDAWIRWLPGNLPAGGYLTLRNDGDRAARLTGVSSDAYRMTMLHRSVVQDAVNHMEPVAEILLPPHQTVAFMARGYHIMLQQPVHAVHPGDHVTVTLHFADGSTLDAACTVRSVADGGG